MFSGWRVIKPRTCGVYTQPCWVSSTGWLGTGKTWPGAKPCEMETTTFFSVPLGLTTTFSSFTGLALCIPSQAGTPFILMTGIFGAAPWKVTLPTIDGCSGSFGASAFGASGLGASAVLGTGAGWGAAGTGMSTRFSWVGWTAV